MPKGLPEVGVRYARMDATHQLMRISHANAVDHEKAQFSRNAAKEIVGKEPVMHWERRAC